MLGWNPDSSRLSNLQKSDQHLHIDLGVFYSIPSIFDGVFLRQAARVLLQPARYLYLLLRGQKFGPLGVVGKYEIGNDS